MRASAASVSPRDDGLDPRELRRHLREIRAALTAGPWGVDELLDELEVMLLETCLDARAVLSGRPSPRMSVGPRGLLEREMAALAEANVEAVLAVDEARERLAAVEEEHGQLVQRNHELIERAAALQLEAEALALANAEAVALLAEREDALAARGADLEELRRAHRLLRWRAVRDDLTGLCSKGFFSTRLPREIARARRHGRALSLMFVDADPFERLDDAHGHVAGDEVLRGLGELLEAHVRLSDLVERTGGGAVAARYGGEEFVLVLPETDLDGARTVAERLRATIEEASLHAETPVTVSIGVATLRPSDTPQSLAGRADRALYLAKHRGRNRVEVEAPE